MTDHDAPTLSVIVLSFNGMEHLPECLSSICNQPYQNFELIIVDNGSTDGSVDYLRDHWPVAQLVALPNNEGFCRGMNRGIRAARGELVLLLNQDLALQPNSLSNLVDTFTHPPIDNHPAVNKQPDRPVLGVFPKVMFYSMPSFINAFGVDWFESCHWRDSRVGLPDLGGLNESETVFGSIFPAVLFHRNRFLNIGGFDEIFWSYCEDFDVCYRGNILGYRFITAPDAIVLHKYRTSSRDTTDPLWSRFWFLRNYLLVFLKNYETRNLRRYGGRIFHRYLGNGIRHAWNTRNKAELILHLRVIGSLIKHMHHIILSRRFIRRNRKMEDELLWKKESVEDYNPFHVEGSIVLSLKSIRAGKGRDRDRSQ
ncbi:glycosyltransferase family 2 protein [bacterium]|nr:glycosyltransferase family 2 protein [candidate division CSSED10-310 bacterium]